VDTSALHVRDFMKAVPKVRIMCHRVDKPVSVVPGMRLCVHERLIL